MSRRCDPEPQILTKSVLNCVLPMIRTLELFSLNTQSILGTFQEPKNADHVKDRSDFEDVVGGQMSTLRIPRIHRAGLLPALGSITEVDGFSICFGGQTVHAHDTSSAYLSPTTAAVAVAKQS